MGENSNLHKILIKLCNKAGFSPNIVLQTNDTLCYGKSIQHGMGLALSRNAAKTDKATTLNVLDLVERQIIYVFYNKQKLFPALKRFLDFLQKSTNHN